MDAPSAHRQSSTPTSWDSAGGPVSLTVKQYGADRSVTTRHGHGRLESSRKTLDAPSMAIAVDSWKESPKVDRATATESIVPTFSAVSKSTGRCGQFTIPSQRVYSEKVNGKLVEVFVVREDGPAHRPPADLARTRRRTQNGSRPHAVKGRVLGRILPRGGTRSYPP